MSDYLWCVFIGHMVGDFLFQTKAMNLRKSEPGFDGIAYCTLHVAIYTLCVCGMIALWCHANERMPTWPHAILIWLVVFLPHWHIDRWSLATAWLRLVGGRQFRHVELPPAILVHDAGAKSGTTMALVRRAPADRFRDFDVAFTSIVYKEVDFTLHFLCLLAVYLIVR